MKTCSWVAVLCLGLVSCGTSAPELPGVLTPAERALFVSDLPNRGDRVDALVAARRPRTTSPGGSIDVAEACEDLAALFATVERIHPSFWLPFGNPMGEARWKARAGRWLDHLTDEGRVARSDLALVLSYATAGFEDGHTGLRLWDHPEGVVEDDAVYPPWPLLWSGDRWTVDGVEVVSLNGRPPSEALEAVLLAVSGERLAWRAQVASDHWGYYLRLVDPFAGTQRFDLMLINGQKRSEPPVDRYRFERARSARNSAPLPRPAFVDLGRGVGLYTYPSFDASGPGLAAIDRVMGQVKAAGVTDLVIDLRNNGGGSTVAGEALLGHLTTRPYRQFRSTVIRWSDEALAQVGRDLWLVPYREGTWTRFNNGPEATGTRDPFVSVKLHLLVGPGTFSSASVFAATVADYALGDLWGYETGGVRTAAGDRIDTRLPETGWALGVSHKLFFGPVAVAGESRHGVVPQHRATAGALAPYRGADDPQVAWVFASLRP